METASLKTLKVVAYHFNRPAHRIIHLCEEGIVRPAVPAAGRGTMRRFSREDTFRVLLALQLQEAGVQVPLIRPLMRALDCLKTVPDARNIRKSCGNGDLVDVIFGLSDPSHPILAFLTPPDHVALLTPLVIVPAPAYDRVEFHSMMETLLNHGVSIMANLTEIAYQLTGTLWKED